MISQEQTPEGTARREPAPSVTKAINACISTALLCIAATVGLALYGLAIPPNPEITAIQDLRTPHEEVIETIPAPPTQRVAETLTREIHFRDATAAIDNIAQDARNAGGHVTAEAGNTLTIVAPEEHLERVTSLMDTSSSEEVREWARRAEENPPRTGTPDTEITIRMQSYAFERRWLSGAIIGLLVTTVAASTIPFGLYAISEPVRYAATRRTDG